MVLLVCPILLFGQNKVRIKGSRQPVQVNGALESFTSVSLDDNLEVLLVQADSMGYRLHADNNLVDVLVMEVEDGVLHIRATHNITSKRKMDVTVFYRNLDSMAVLNGFLRADNMDLESGLKLYTAGTANLELHGHAPFLDAHFTGAGASDLYMNSDSLVVRAQDRVDFRIYQLGQYAAYELNHNATASLEGQVENASLVLQDKVNCKAGKMETAHLHVQASGNSTAVVRATQTLRLDINGDSRVKLYGAPTITVDDFSGSAQLIKEKD